MNEDNNPPSGIEKNISELNDDSKKKNLLFLAH